MNKAIAILCLLSGVLLQSGCAATGTPGIDVAVDRAEGVDWGRYASYELQTRDLPGFLREYAAGELRAELAALGLAEAGADAPLSVTLRYVQLPLDRSQSRPPLEHGDGESAPQHFVARLDLAVVRRADGVVLRSGSLSRVHHVVVGEYMHPRSRSAIRRAFRELLVTAEAGR